MASGYAVVREPGFSVAALVGFFARALAMQNPELLPADFKLADLRDTRKSIAVEKRRLADHALQVGGPQPLLAVGRMVGQINDHPNIAVLLDANSSDMLAWRWMRIEHAHHSPHLVDIQIDEKQTWKCTHNARDAIPSRAESLLVIGILAGLLELIGAQGIEITLGEEHVQSHALASGTAANEPLPYNQFRITWSYMGASPQEYQATSSPTEEPSLEERLLTMLRKEPARAWRIAEVAEHFALSTRSLQRRLNDAGYSFDTLIREARVAEAAQWLRLTNHTLEFITHKAGFTDQPHFQREFVRILDITPAIYREVANSI